MLIRYYAVACSKRTALVKLQLVLHASIACSQVAFLASVMSKPFSSSVTCIF